MLQENGRPTTTGQLAGSGHTLVWSLHATLHIPRPSILARTAHLTASHAATICHSAEGGPVGVKAHAAMLAQASRRAAAAAAGAVRAPVVQARYMSAVATDVRGAKSALL